MTDFPQTSHHYQWLGRHDAEDGQLGTRVHHVMQCLQASELNGEQHAVSLVGFECDAV